MEQTPLKYCAWLYFYFLDTGNTQYIQLNENVNGEILQKAGDACTSTADALESKSADIEKKAESLRTLADKAKAHVESIKQHQL